MSQWTYVLGVIEVETAKWSHLPGAIVRKILDSAPKITGSESDCDIFYNVLSGHNCSSGGYDEELKKYVTKEYQTKVLITIQGSLRDREIEETIEEYQAFLAYLKAQKEIYVNVRNVIIYPTYGQAIFRDVSIQDEDD